MSDKVIIEGIQKKLGVFTTTEALQSIDALLAVAEAAKKVAKINPSGDWACNEWDDNQPLFDLKDALEQLKEVRKE